MKVIKVCQGPSCSKSFSEYTFDRAAQELHIKSKNGGVSPDGNFTLETCPCQGNCKKAVTVVTEIDGNKKLHAHVSSAEMGKLIKQMKA